MYIRNYTELSLRFSFRFTGVSMCV